MQSSSFPISPNSPVAFPPVAETDTAALEERGPDESKTASLRSALSGWRWIVLVLLGIMLVGTWLRLAGHNWDQNQHLNADDYYVARVATKRVNVPPNSSFASLVDPQNSPLNPRSGGEFYVYGALPLYLVKAASSLTYALTHQPFFSGLDGVLQTGRIMSGLSDMVTALLVFFIGLRLWGAAQGLLASALYSFGVLPIQMGHFYLVDVFMTTFMTATVLFSILYFQKRQWWTMLLAGICLGLALACKLSAAPVVVVPLLALLLVPLTSDRSRRAWQKALALTAMLAVSAFAGLFVGDPFAILNAGTYKGVLETQAAIQGGSIDQWFSRKYVGTWPVLHFLGQLALLGIGPLVGVAAAPGVALVAWRVWRERIWAQLLLLAGALAYFASIAFVELKWVRYLLPLVPYLALFAAALPFWLRESVEARGLQLRTRWPSVALGALLVVSAVLGAFAVSSIYRSEHTQIRASRWLYENAPLGSSIGYEYTAIDMPLPLPGHPGPRQEYKLVRMDPLDDRPSQAASDALFAELSQCDYLILDSTQAMRTVPRLPWRYPVQIRYYDLLNSGQLGFKMVLKATSYPRLFGIEIPDDGGWVDLSFMDSSHPPTYVYKRDRTLSKEEWSALFADAVKQPSIPSRYRPG